MIRYSPTPYNVFTAYTIRSEFQSDGSCVSVTNPPVTLPTAYSQPIPRASGVVYLNEEGEQQFLDFLKISGCSRGGGNTQPIVVAQIQDITVETTLYQTGGVLAPAIRTLGRVSCWSFSYWFERHPIFQDGIRAESGLSRPKFPIEEMVPLGSTGLEDFHCLSGESNTDTWDVQYGVDSNPVGGALENETYHPGVERRELTFLDRPPIPSAPGPSASPR